MMRIRSLSLVMATTLSLSACSNNKVEPKSGFLQSYSVLRGICSVGTALG